MNSPQQRIVAGVDVAEDSLEVVIIADDGLRAATKSFRNDRRGVASLIRHLHRHGTDHVVLEATGGLERPLTRTLLEHEQFKVSVVNARLPRDFARSLNQLNKTDALDARAIAGFGLKTDPRPVHRRSDAEELLNALFMRRDDLMNMIQAEENRLRRCEATPVRRQINRSIRQLRKQLVEIEGEMRACIDDDPDLRERDQQLQSVPGVGPVASAAVLALMPELGGLSREAVARLAGVAPVNRDSGKMRGQRTIGGGRPLLRKALYMAALVGMRHNPVLRRMYERLRANGKAPKVALIACMRKLIVILNTMIKRGESWRTPDAASTTA